MRHQVGLGQRSTSPIFADPFGDLLLVCRVVDSGAFIHDVYACLFLNSTFSTDGVFCASYFCAACFELQEVATSQMTHRRLLFL